MPSAVATITPSNVPPLPVPGDLKGQLSQAQGLVSKFGTATTPGAPGQQAALADLLGAGVTMIGQAVGGTGQTLIRTMVTIGSDVAAGAAVGGPFGAAAGAIVGVGQAIAQLFQNGPPVYAGFLIDSTAGSGRLAALVAAWQTMNEGITSGAAQGESFGSYLVAQVAPRRTLRPRLLWSLVNQTGSLPPVDAQGSAMPLVGSEGGGGFGGASWPPTPADIVNAQTYLGLVQPIDLAVLWGWPDPTNAATSTADYAASFQQISQQGSRQLWQDDTKAIVGPHGMSVASIMASALRRAPDPLYFAQDLYIGAAVSAGNAYTLVTNTAAASALATVLGLLAVGAKTQAIVSELELQQKVLELLDYSAGPVDPHGVVSQLESDLANAKSNPASHPQSGTTGYTAAQIAQLEHELAQAKAGHFAPPIPLLFRQLVEDYVALAHAEKHNPNATMLDVIRSNRPYEPAIASSAPSSAPSPAAQAQGKATIQRWLNFYLGGGG
jgi:hypothetical protein